MSERGHPFTGTVTWVVGKPGEWRLTLRVACENLNEFGEPLEGR